MDTKNISFDADTKILSAANISNEIANTKGVGCFFFNCMKKHGNNIAQIDVVTGEKDTYNALLLRCIRTAIEMKSRGIKPGDIVAVCSYNHLNSAVPYIASQLIGAVFTAVDVTINLEDSKYLINLVKPKMIFVAPNAEKLIATVVADIQLDTEIICFAKSEQFASFDEFICEKTGEDLFEPFIPANNKVTTNILFSSGTTGLPKGICLNHNTILVHKQFDYLKGNDVLLSFSSLYWVSSYFLINLSVNGGMCRLISPGFNPKDFFTTMVKYKATFAFLDPTQIIQCLSVFPDNFNHPLGYLMLGGSPISDKYLKQVLAVFPKTNVVIGYGQSELGVTTVLNNVRDMPTEKFRSCGILSEGLQCKIVDCDTEQALGPNQVGEIRIKSPSPMNGYYKMDSNDCFDKDGFLKTGDLGYFDNEFYFFITDRLKEMFKYLSWHIVPAKIESILLQHPDVAVAIVVGVPHPEDSNHAMGIVTVNKNSNVTAKELELFMDKQLDDRHRLRAGIRIIDDFIYTPSGKVRRKETRDKVLKSEIA